VASFKVRRQPELILKLLSRTFDMRGLNSVKGDGKIIMGDE
jgi:hypothetical protein